ncbi:MAG: 3'(2'),5'-bisphosphate nucleotidase CysQ [Novosphingobium sp.]
MDAGNLSDAALAAQLAAAAGDLLLERRAALRADGVTGKPLGAEGDAAANALICEALRGARPDDGLLSEEEKDNPARLAKSRVWIVDPLDGTREFGEERSDWAVHVALAIDGAAVAGAVALPGAGVVLRSDDPVAVPPPPARLRMVVSRTRPAAEALAVAAALDAEVIPMGSAGAKAMAVVLGQADIYLHSGGQFEWDSCAPVAVALGHGLHASRIDGSPLVYNQADTYMPDLLICRREHAALVLGTLAAV